MKIIRSLLVSIFLVYSTLVISATASDSAIVRAQILLDRAGFSPGEIDGTMGGNTMKALREYQEISGLPVTGRLDRRTLDSLNSNGTPDDVVDYTITEKDSAGPFTQSIPEDPMEQAKLSQLGYGSLQEALGEKFHCSPAILGRLNPNAKYGAGETIRVPNTVEEEPTPDSTARKAASDAITVVVNEKSDIVIAKDAQDQVIFFAPATAGSEKDPLPKGEWKVTEVLRNPTFYYDPVLFWDAKPDAAKTRIAAGPNNPVGIVWIGIDAPHYGLHGTPQPEIIGHSASHGCVRMTNWDAARLARLIRPGTSVIFE